MKYAFTILLFLSLSAAAQSPGDTIVVKTIDYTMTYGSGDRDTLVYFPTDPSLSFEKIIMQYSMRCKDGLVSPPISGQTNIGCGEWDYSCNTYIEDDSRADSVARTTSSVAISNFSGTQFDYIPNPTIDFHRKVYKKTNLNSVISETTHSVGSYAADINHAFPLQHFDAKSMYLYTAAELSAAGLTAGNIDGFFLFPINTISVDFCKIKMKNTTLTGLSPVLGADTTGFMEVYFDELNAYAFPTGHRVMFHSPFVWDGVSNILIQFSYTNTTGNGGSTLPKIKGYSGTYQGMYASGAQYPVFQSTNYLTVDGYKGIGGSDNRTVEAWIKTSTANKEIVFWGENSNTKKWIVRVNGGGQLRAEVAGGYIIGTTSLTDDKWHHIAVVLDGSSVNDIKLYVDGSQEAISSSQNSIINTENTTSSDVMIGHGSNNTYFDGNIDNVRIWSTALTQARIHSWMHTKLNSLHPNYGSLELDLSMDSLDNGSWTDRSVHGRDASTTGGLWLERSYGEYLHDNFQLVDQKPQIEFFRGTYNTTTTLDSNWFYVYRNPNTVIQKTIVDHSGTTMSDEINQDSVAFLWDVTDGYRYYAESGSFESSTSITAQGSITPSTLNYWERNPMRFEIMSFVTPYGINLDLGPEGKMWSFDLTDFSPILRGTKRMIMNKGGQWQEDMDIKFLFVVGTPERDVIDISNIWKSDRSTSYTDIPTAFATRTLPAITGATGYAIRSTITGHGQQGEFVPRTHSLQINGSTANSWQAWKTCGSNPIYPQGGTWIYDRAGWCPGMATDLVRTELSAPTFPLQADYSVSAATGDSRYIVSHQLVAYSDPNFGLDAELVDILNPSKKIEHAKTNPSCVDPAILVRGTGTTPITSMTIEYGVNGGAHKASYNWTGNIEFGEEVTIDLPTAGFDIWSDIDRDTDNLFFAKIISVNSTVPENEHNSEARSYFDVPRIYPPGLAFLIFTNGAAAETTYEIFDMFGNAVFSENYTTNNSSIRDTVHLAHGCYTLRISDSDGDGYSFWANQDGNGSLRIYNAAGGFLEMIDGDFGNFYEMQFTVDWPLSYEQYSHIWDVQLYPNPTRNTLHVTGEKIEESSWEVVDMLGRKLRPLHTASADMLTIDVSQVPPGVYLLEAQLDDARVSKKFVVE